MTFAAKTDAISHVGKIRANNQDSGYAGSYLFAVADGMGGYAGGDVASAIAISVIRDLDQDPNKDKNLHRTVSDTIIKANQEITAMVDERPELARMGTTFSGLLLLEDRALLAHIGDSRIYLFRDGKLVQRSADHTFVQRLVDAGRITPEEALTHPRRSVLMRVLGDVDIEPEIDLEEVELAEGDVWLLCSDGLSGYASEEKMQQILATTPDLNQANRKLLQVALDNGAPDNVTSVLVEIVSGTPTATDPIIVGSASDPDVNKGIPDRRLFSFGMLRHPIRAAQQIEHAVPEDQESYLQHLIAADRRRATFRKVRWLLALIVILALAAAALWLGYNWTQTQFYVGVSDGYVSIYQGIPQSIASFQLSEVIQISNLEVADLQQHWQQNVINTIGAPDLVRAEEIVEQLRSHVTK